jgi:23S rRNA (adenine2503-C2)-methyltransferase
MLNHARGAPAAAPGRLLALQGTSAAQLAQVVDGLTLAEARKVVSAVHRGRSLGEPVVGVRRTSLETIRRVGHVPSLEVHAERASAVDPFVKFALRTHDDHLLETVRIPLERAGRFSACVSSQVGCALACRFCATGRMGLVRNLETWEIVEQVRVVRRSLVSDPRTQGGRVHGVVFQGMGEPLSNLDRVLEAVATFCDPSALAIDARAITVCTAGLPTGIRRLAREAPRVRLAISIAGGRREVRRSLMPIEASHPLDEVIDAAVEHARVTGLAPLWAMTLLAGVNDAPEDALALAELATSFAARAGVRPRISIIPYNAIDAVDDPFRRTADAKEIAYRAVLAERGHPSHKRYSGGADVDAACGQLAGRA